MEDFINLLLSGGILTFVIMIALPIVLIVAFLGMCINVKDISDNQKEIERKTERYLASMESYMQLQNNQIRTLVEINEKQIKSQKQA